VRLWLSDGRVRAVDLTESLNQPAFAAVRADRARYEQAHLSPVDGVLSWLGDLNLDTRTLVGDESGA
jgi:hypothetical protein